MRNQLLKFLQVGISALCIYLFVNQLNINELADVLFDVRLEFLFLAMLFFVLSQYLS